MFRKGILLMPRRRYSPPSNALFWFPAKEMVYGVSPNLLTWNGAAPSTGWTGTRATLSDETTPTPPVSAKALKILANDGVGVGASVATQTIATFAKYAGVTSLLTIKGYALSANILDESLTTIYDGVATTYSATSINRDDAWHNLSVSRRLNAAISTLIITLRAKSSSTANTTDILYIDDPKLTVPQCISRDSFRRLLHPAGSYITGKGEFSDGIDDLRTCETDLIGTNAILAMGWMYPLGWGGGGFGRILDNGKILFYATASDTSINALIFSSDGNTKTASANNSIALNKWIFYAVTRAADGTVNFYIGSPTVRPVLSGSANQASGTPAAGATLLTFNNRPAGDRGFNGYKAYELILPLSANPLADINNFWDGTHYEFGSTL